MKKMAVLLGALLSLSAMAEGGSWGHKSELGLVDAQGNSVSTIVTAKHGTTYEKGKGKLGLSGQYNYGKAEDATGTASINIRNWDAIVRYDRSFSERLSWFVQTGVIGDRFRDIRWRAFFDLPGISYQIIKRDNKDDKDFFTMDFAYRFTMEESYSGLVTEKDNSHAVLGFHYSKPVNSKLLFLSDLVYTKRFTGDERTEITAFVGAESTLSEMFALKVGYTVNYDDTLKDRNAVSETQRTFAASLIATY